ncbi:MAG TPA: hypothetical protein VF635_01910 [Propionibacteriaceae bacterium]|jgi:hypothetical protein
MSELAPGAIGWLGSTTGVTDDSILVSVARFESAAAARASRERPGHRRWWQELADLCDPPPTYHHCSRVVSDAMHTPEG